MDSDIRHPCRFFGALDCDGLYCGFKDRGLNWKTCGWCNGVVKNGIEYPLEDKPMCNCSDCKTDEIKSLKSELKKQVDELTAENKQLKAEKDFHTGILNSISNSFDLECRYDYASICDELKKIIANAESGVEELEHENRNLRENLGRTQDLKRDALAAKVKDLEGKLETALVLEKVAIERTSEIERILSQEVKQLRAEKENYAGVLNSIVNTFDLGLDYDYPAICTQIKRRLDDAEGASDILRSGNKSLRSKLESVKQELEELKKHGTSMPCYDRNKFCTYTHTAALLEQVKAECDRAWQCHNELAEKHGKVVEQLKLLEYCNRETIQECNKFHEKSIYLEKKLLEKRTRNRTCWCVWCGEHFPLDKDTGRKMKEHVKVCKKHPMRELEQQVKKACPCPYAASCTKKYLNGWCGRHER